MNESRETKGKATKEEALPTLWRVPDALWERIEPLLAEHDPPKATGRKRADARKVLDTLIFRLRSGCQWNHLPPDLADDSTAHRALERWVESGIFEKIWALLLEACEDLGGVDWEWPSADGALGKARLGGISSARTRPTGARPAPSGAS